MEFREDLISMQDIGVLRYRLHSHGVLTLDEMEILSGLVSPYHTRIDQVYRLLFFLNQKSNGPFKLIEVLQEMASDHNYLGEIAETLIREYCKLYDIVMM